MFRVPELMMVKFYNKSVAVKFVIKIGMRARHVISFNIASYLSLLNQSSVVINSSRTQEFLLSLSFIFVEFYNQNDTTIFRMSNSSVSWVGLIGKSHVWSLYIDIISQTGVHLILQTIISTPTKCATLAISPVSLPSDLPLERSSSDWI